MKTILITVLFVLLIEFKKYLNVHVLMDNLNPMTCVMNVPILVLIVKITNITVLFVLLIESKLLIVIVLPAILIMVLNNLNVKFVIINVLLVLVKLITVLPVSKEDSPHQTVTVQKVNLTTENNLNVKIVPSDVIPVNSLPTNV